jgi:mannosyltransferase
MRAHTLYPRLEESNRNNSGWSCGIVSMLGVISLAAVIRFAGIHSQSFYYDEVVSRELSFHSFYDLFIGIARDNGNPPLYWILIKAWSLVFGSGETALRAFSAFAGVACTALVYLMAKEYFDERVALIASIAYALSPFSLELSTEARCYAWLQLVATASFYCFFRFWIRHQALWLSGVLLCTVLLTFTHYYGFFIPLAQMIILLTFRQYRKLLAWLSAMTVAACIFALGWLPVFLAQLDQPGNGTRGGPSWIMQFLSTPLAFAVGRSLVWKGSVSLAGLAAVSLIVIAVFWLSIASFGCDKSRDSRLRFALLAWLSLPVIVPFVVALSGHPIYNARYAMIALPAFALAFGAGVARLTPWRQICTLAAALVLVGVSLGSFYFHPIKQDWERTTAFLASELKAGDVVFVDPDYEVMTMNYYAQKIGLSETAEVGIVQAGEPLIGIPWIGGHKLASTPQDVSTAIRTHQRIWLVITGGSYGDQTDLSVLRSAACNVSDSHHFYRIDVYKFRCSAGTSF